MLSVALEKKYEAEQDILFLCQDMTELDLYGTVDTTVCALDSINHVTDPEQVRKIFEGVSLFTVPGGLFLFDVNTPYKFKHIYGDNAYILEDEWNDEDGSDRSVYCGWQNHFDEASNLCTFDLSLFEEREDGGYDRSDEMQTERCYTQEQLETILKETGFEILGCFGAWNFSQPKEECERYYFVARAIK
jgi:SAM-dependent methyltransferase